MNPTKAYPDGHGAAEMHTSTPAESHPAPIPAPRDNARMPRMRGMRRNVTGPRRSTFMDRQGRRLATPAYAVRLDTLAARLGI